MNDETEVTSFWNDETCEYCGGAIVEKQVTLHRHVKGEYFLFEHVPVGVCQICGTRYFAANILKRIEESMRGQQKAEREVLVLVYSM